MIAPNAGQWTPAATDWERNSTAAPRNSSRVGLIDRVSPPRPTAVRPGSVCHHASVSAFEYETATDVDADGRLLVTPSAAWNIGDNANGGYALSLVLRAASQVTDHADPLSVTTHFLRPVQPDGSPAEVELDVIRSGRTTSVVRGILRHAGKDRLQVIAAFGDLGAGFDDDCDGDPDAAPELAADPPPVPPPDACTDRARLEQGVALPILERVEVRIDPALAEPGSSDRAEMIGWIRLADGSPPDALALALFADAFPPSLYPRFGRIGWVPTVELTVHVRRRPAPGWVLARLECDDLTGGRMIETGSLWDSTGALVARSRQLGLLLDGSARPTVG